jgi:hypothetical protein
VLIANLPVAQALVLAASTLVSTLGAFSSTVARRCACQPVAALGRFHRGRMQDRMSDVAHAKP